MALLLQDQYLLGCCRSTRVRLRHLQSNEFIWTWSPPPFGNGARLYLEKEPHLEMEPACLEMEPTALFGNRARPHPETEHGSIWNFAWKWSPALYLEMEPGCLEMEPGEMEPGPTQKRSTALFGTLLGNGARLYLENAARLHLEMEPGSCRAWFKRVRVKTLSGPELRPLSRRG